MSESSDVLTFWFGDPATEDTSYAARRQLWFGKDEAFDQAIRTRFHGLYDRAVAGERSTWAQSPAGCLALLLLFDQFPRNMFRGTPQAFAADALARSLAIAALTRRVSRFSAPFSICR